MNKMIEQAKLRIISPTTANRAVNKTLQLFSVIVHHYYKDISDTLLYVESMMTDSFRQ